jgi:hypothetical protein
MRLFEISQWRARDAGRLYAASSSWRSDTIARSGCLQSGNSAGTACYDCRQSRQNLHRRRNRRKAGTRFSNPISLLQTKRLLERTTPGAPDVRFPRAYEKLAMHPQFNELPGAATA